MRSLDYVVTFPKGVLIYQVVRTGLVLLSLVMYVCVSRGYQYRIRDWVVNVQWMVEEVFERRMDQEESYNRRQMAEEGILFENSSSYFQGVALKLVNEKGGVAIPEAWGYQACKGMVCACALFMQYRGDRQAAPQLGSVTFYKFSICLMALTARRRLGWASPPFAGFFAGRGLRRLKSV